jgi:hypothetical protein
MAFSEALSDDGKLSGPGNPWKRGLASGLMTFAGAIGHRLPFLFVDFSVAMMIVTITVVIELFAFCPGTGQVYANSAGENLAAGIFRWCDCFFDRDVYRRKDKKRSRQYSFMINNNSQHILNILLIY